MLRYARQQNKEGDEEASSLPSLPISHKYPSFRRIAALVGTLIVGVLILTAIISTFKTRESNAAMEASIQRRRMLSASEHSTPEHSTSKREFPGALNQRFDMKFVDKFRDELNATADLVETFMLLVSKQNNALTLNGALLNEMDTKAAAIIRDAFKFSYGDYSDTKALRAVVNRILDRLHPLIRSRSLKDAAAIHSAHIYSRETSEEIARNLRLLETTHPQLESMLATLERNAGFLPPIGGIAAMSPCATAAISNGGSDGQPCVYGGGMGCENGCGKSGAMMVVASPSWSRQGASLSVPTQTILLSTTADISAHGVPRLPPPPPRPPPPPPPLPPSPFMSRSWRWTAVGSESYEDPPPQDFFAIVNEPRERYVH